MAPREHAEKFVLIVEDNAVESTGMAVLLKRAGHEIKVVRDGGRALEFLAEQTPDLVLLDMLLPDMDGCKFMARLRETSWKQVPVIITTSLNIASVEWARSLGARDFVRKPVDFVELIRKIRQYTTPADVPSEPQLTASI